MVRKYLSKKHVIQEEDLLEKIADSTDRSEQLKIHTNQFHIHVQNLDAVVCSIF